jgi:hypothetical protein
MIDSKGVRKFAVGATAILTALAVQNISAQEIAKSEDQQHSSVAPPDSFENMLFDDPEAAFILLEAHHASKAGQPEFDLHYAYADYRANGRKRRAERKLKQAIEAYDAAGGEETYFLGRILTDYAAIQLENKQERFARATANRAEAILTAARPDDLRARMWPILWAGYSYFLEDPIFDVHLVNAYEEFSRARALFATQDVEDKLASGELEAIAAQAAAAGLLATRNPRAAELDQMRGVFQIPKGAEIDALCAGSLTGKAPSVARNAPDWAPHFTSMLRRGHVVSVDFDADGRVASFSVLAEPFPPIVRDDDKFHDRFRDRDLRKALKRWRLASDADARCRENRILVLTGYSRNEDDAFFNPRQIMDDLSRY